MKLGEVGITQGGHAYDAGILPYPILSGNSSQRLTYVKFFINAQGGDVSDRDLVCVDCPCEYLQVYF